MNGSLVLNLSFHCTLDDSTAKHDFVTSKNPDSVTVSEVKEHVEKEYQIPAHCQSLYFESTLLRDEDTLAKTSIREGDTIVVEYDTDADVNDVNKIISILRMLLGVVQRHSNILAEFSAHRMQQLCATTEDLRKLINSTFYYYDEYKRVDANRVLFLHKGGFDIVYDLYRLVLQTDYEESVLLIRLLENVVIEAVSKILIVSFGRIPLLKQLYVDSATLDYTLKSFTRVPISHHQEIVAPSGPTEEFTIAYDQLVQNRILIRSMEESILSTSNLCEVEEFQVKIASNDVVMQQLLSVAFSPTFDIFSIRLALDGFGYLSTNGGTHVYLTSPTLIECMLSVSRHHQRKAYNSKSQFLLDTMTLKAVIAAYFSELVSYSADIIPLPFKGKIYHFLHNFLRDADPVTIREQREEHAGVNLVSPLSLPYAPLRLTNPYYSTAHNDLMIKLKELCVEFGVFSIHFELIGEYERTNFISQGLVDYVVCLPWLMSAGSKSYERARVLVSYLSEEMVLQPPSLINIARAKLAKMHFGLRKVLEFSVNGLIEEYYDAKLYILNLN